MKKLLVLALSALLVLGLATVSMAAATLSGEAQVRYSGSVTDGDSTYAGNLFGKIALSGKIDDDVTGAVVYIADQSTSITLDEASILFTEDWGTFKAGYYGWNTNLKDIVNASRGDVKQYATLSVGLPISDNLSLGLAYALPNADTEVAPYGAKLGLTGDNFGLDVMYTNTGASVNSTGSGSFANSTGIGVQAKIKLDAFTPFFQYENYDNGAAIDSIVGFLFDPAAPFYARGEVDLTALNGVTEWGVRFGYYMNEAKTTKIQAQYKVTAALDGTNLDTEGTTTAAWYLRLIAAF